MPESTSLVQHKETTVRQCIPDTFQAYKRRFCESDWLAAESIYELFPGVSRESRLSSFRNYQAKILISPDIFSLTKPRDPR